MAREVLTFQLGNLSNFVGTHWWNLQVRAVTFTIFFFMMTFGNGASKIVIRFLNITAQ